MSPEVVFWLVVMIGSIVVEIFTMGLTSIWFAAGGAVAVFIAKVGGPFWLQLAGFAIVSILLLVFTRPFAMNHFNKERLRTNVESLVGCKAVVTSEVDNLKGIGQVTVNGQEWSARHVVERRVIPVGVIVTIVAVNGVKLMVEIDESVADHVPEIRSEAELDPRVIEADAENRYQ